MYMYVIPSYKGGRNGPAPVDTSNSHSTTVIGEDLNSVLSMFNQALQNAYDAGNWIHKYPCFKSSIT